MQLNYLSNITIVLGTMGAYIMNQRNQELNKMMIKHTLKTDYKENDKITLLFKSLMHIFGRYVNSNSETNLFKEINLD